MPRSATPRSALSCCALAVLILGLAPGQAALAQDRSGGQAGPRGQITGTVADAETGSPIASAAVAVWQQADSTLVTGAVTDTDGAFSVERLRPGTYYVEVSFLGYATERIGGVAVGPDAPRADLGAVRLAPQAEALDAVEVAAEREFVQVEVDRTVYNVADQPVAQSGSATDVLQNVPSVEVDVDGNVSLRGNGNVAILINGRTVPVTGEALASFLRQMPGDAIERVEVLPNPSAKYDPEGMGGIINLVMKENAELGLSGGVTAGIGTDNQYNGSVNLGYQKGRLNAYGSYSLRHGERDILGLELRENRLGVLSPFIDQDETGDRRFTSHLLNTSVDYTLTDQAVLSLQGVTSLRDGRHRGRTAYVYLDADEAPMRLTNRLNDGSYDGFNADVALLFAQTWEQQRHTLNAEVRYNWDGNERADRFARQAVTLGGVAGEETVVERSAFDADAGEATAQLDYVRPALGGKLEAGYKGSLRQLDNALAITELDEAAGAFEESARSNAFDYDERVHAGYVVFGRPVGPVEAQVGLRVEHTDTAFDLATTGERFDNDYVSVFPSAFVQYAFAEGKSVKASYSRRINRPNTWYLNPFAIQEDPLNLRVGNPYLGPEYTNAFEVGYTQVTGWGSLTFTPYYRHTTDVISRYIRIDEAGVTTLTFENFDTSDSYGLEAIASVRPAPWLNGFVSFNGYQVVSDASNVEADLGNDAFGWMARGNASVELPRGLSLQLTYFYRAPLEVEQARIGAFQMADVALRKKLLGDRASLTLRISDVFDQMQFTYFVDQPAFVRDGERRWDARQATLTFSYDFGQPQKRRPQRRPQNDGGGMDDMGGF